MAHIISDDIKKALADKNTIKALATVDKNGQPYVVYKGFIHLNEQNQIELNEILESSQNNSNLVYAIWFEKTVALNILTEEKKSYQLRLKPVKSITSGRYFEKVYNQIRSNGRDIDLGAIWQFEILDEKEETPAKRFAEDEEKYPILKHIDRLLKAEA